MNLRSGSRRMARWFLLPAVIACLVAQAAPAVLAADAQTELKQAQEELEAIRQAKADTRNALADAQRQAEDAQVQLRTVEGDLAAANSQLAVITNQLTAAQTGLQQVEAELEQTKKKAAQKQQALAKRVRAINEEGRVSYLSVLLGSSTFSDFISRFDMLTLVVRKDAALFDEVRRAKLALEERQQEASARRNKLADLKAQAEVRRITISSKREERQTVSRSLESAKRSLQSRLNEFDRQEDLMMDQVVTIQRRLARKAGKFAPTSPVQRPIIITDPFGPRLHPILGVWRPHNGTDFNARMGSPVMAIEDGLVIVASWNDSYGWLTVIDHGNGISSWYGHSSKLLVKVNDNVKQGQRIADAGTTGWSTGPHVHLEIRINGNPENPMNYISQ